jgi:hypothetical protein
MAVMKAFEFVSPVNADGTLSIPAAVAAQLQPQQPVRVLLLVAEAEEEGEWARLTAEQFFKGYDDGDAIYDSLPARS